MPAEALEPLSSGGLVTLVLDEELNPEVVVERVLKLLKSEEVEDEAAEVVVFETVLLGSLSLLLVDVVLLGVDVLVEVETDEELVDDIKPRSSEVELLEVLGSLVDVDVNTGASVEVEVEVLVLATGVLVDVEVLLLATDVLVEVEADKELVDEIKPRSSEVEPLEVLGNVVDVEVTTGASVELEVEVLVLATGVLVDVEVLVPVSEVVVEVEVDAENRSPPKIT